MRGSATGARPDLEHLVPEYIKAFQPYIPSKPDDVLCKMLGCPRLYRLNNNENPLGPPPAAQKIIAGYPPPRAAIYPSGDAYHLRCRLADRFGLHPDQFLVGNGANEVISFVIKAFCQEGDNIVTADRTFAVYEWVALFSGFGAHLVPLRDFDFDDEALLERVDARTKILFVCNPNNPTGTYWSEQRLRRFLDRLAGRQIVVIDEAYAEFVEQADFPDGLQLLADYPNLVVFRTFSKMYGLAGLRIGYLAGSREVVDIIRRTCVVYSVNGLAQEAALAALADHDHIPATRQLVAEAKAGLTAELDGLGLSYVNGEGNFLMVKLPMNDALAYRRLMAHGVMIRSMTGFRFPNWIRISIAGPQAMSALVEALQKVLSNDR
ncbi:histidinol-phosphate transaminase [Desulfofustis glycolicus]|uniref:Histidinol-phosphate aminotransferase n=1 Tax=Desulfofustis glycolicus DSM 9705 TaxID=1121409 RepID=A0A1M5TNI5_9BACT|nr:histidinol-phosphate transaminase [Desulfofustis glycolicus]MCB2216511.1 histidinol-phosphate transaminase [Desulfobulbaceae bacterium]SHH52332.1 histidinol phosphate aminotransferase apoenzyme [Desulfofustis glycolicus DSM 9705]